jgi:Replication-relaxation
MVLQTEEGAMKRHQEVLSMLRERAKGRTQEQAAAGARGRLRPDGYGVLRLAGRRHGFFLEYDRGTQDAASYRRKLDSHYAYRDSGRYAGDYQGFPAILFVTIDTDVEARIAGIARAVARGRIQPLPLLLTSEWRYRGDAARPAVSPGLLGRIWRTPDYPTRRPWPAS